eukprot:snap_masked-scaffold_9-processed-gene-12.19-mRNA-1 protein AED:1.00 eAED:1.00 QI:0/-1/0/0/-1/1/1/0/249
MDLVLVEDETPRFYLDLKDRKIQDLRQYSLFNKIIQKNVRTILSLNLSGNNLDEEVINSLLPLESLRKLNLSRCNLRKIHPEWKLLRYLRSLNLSCNFLKDPSCFENLRGISNLRKLNLTKNFFENTIFGGFDNLEKLLLRENRFRSIDQLEHLILQSPNLRLLDLRSNCFSKSECKEMSLTEQKDENLNLFRMKNVIIKDVNLIRSKLPCSLLFPTKEDINKIKQSKKSAFIPALTYIPHLNLRKNFT